MEHFFSYVTGSLTDVSFNVYAAEDIRAADGVSENYYTKDQLVGTITTDGTGIAELDNLPLGKYYIVEKETSYGCLLYTSSVTKMKIHLTTRRKRRPQKISLWIQKRMMWKKRKK